MNNLGFLMGMSKNPQQMIQQMMNNSQAMQNPMIKNAIEMYQKGDRQGVNELAQNLCKEKGLDYTDVASKVKSRFGI